MLSLALVSEPAAKSRITSSQVHSTRCESLALNWEAKKRGLIYEKCHAAVVKISIPFESIVTHAQAFI